jgi:hypothetical protein
MGDNLGIVTVQGIAGNVERNVQIELSGEDYHNAILAHAKRAFVQCSGNLRRPPKLE